MRTPFVLATLLGTAAGLAMSWIEGMSSRGPLVLIPLGVLTALLLALFWLVPTDRLSVRVYAAMAAFAASGVVLYAFIVFIDSPTALANGTIAGHAWRLARVLLLSFVAATSIAFLTARRGEQV